MKPPQLANLIREGVNLQVKRWPTYTGEELDRRNFVTASEVGGCLRQAYLTKRTPMKESGDGWGYAERGHAVEAWIVDKINTALDNKAHEWEFLNIGQNQVSYHYNFQSGTPDGILLRTVSNHALVLDIKSIDPRTNRKNLPRKKDIKQVHQNADLLRKCLNLNVVGAILFYMDASNFEDSVQKNIDLDENLIRLMEERARRVMTAKDQSDLPPEGLLEANGCKYCPVTSLCNGFAEQEAKETASLKEAERALEDVFRNR